MAATSSTALVKARAKGAQAATGLVKTLADPKKTKRLLTVSKIIAPVIAPLALKAVDVARSVADHQRARKLGVDVADIADYRGPTGRSNARIDAVAQAVRDLRERRTGEASVIAFTDRANATIADLRTATATAAPMPPARRRPTLAAVKRELDTLEAEVIAHLVRSGL